VEATPKLQVYDLGHLGLVASIVDRIGLVPLVDERVGPRLGEKVSTGVALKAAILNALGFVSSPLYLFGHYWEGKPTEWLLGEGVTPGLLNDDRMGRMLDTLYQAGVTELFLEVAKRARQAFPFPVQALHVDATSFHVHGRHEGTEEEARAIRITHGYSRDHRPDLKQWVMDLVCADTGGIPLLFAPQDGNASDPKTLVALVSRFREDLDLGEWWCWTGRATPGRTSGPWRGSPGSCGSPPPCGRPGPSWRRVSRQGERPGLPFSRGTGGWRWRGRTGEWGSAGSSWRARSGPGQRRKALEGVSRGLPYHRLVCLGCGRKGSRGGWAVPGRGRPRWRCATVSWPAWRWTRGSWSGRGGGWGGSSWPPQRAGPGGASPLGGAETVQGPDPDGGAGFRFLKDPLFFTGSTFLKRPERVMALALVVYALGEWELRRRLEETGSSLPNQKRRPTPRPTLRWVFQLFMWVRLVELEGRLLALNPAFHHETAVRLLGAGRYDLLE
jgi:hypothetical protein